MFSKLINKIKTFKVSKNPFDESRLQLSNLSLPFKQIRMPELPFSRFSQAWHNQLTHLQSTFPRLFNPNTLKGLLSYGRELRRSFTLRKVATSLFLTSAIYVGYEYNPYMTSIDLYYDHNDFNNALVPSLKSLYNTHFYPSLICTTPLLQAIMNQNKPGAAITFTREPLSMPDGGQITLDWALPTKALDLSGTLLHGRHYPYQPSKDNKIMMILHGLTGGSETNYIQALVDAARVKGYRVVVVNQRGINQPLKTAMTFHGGSLKDLEIAIDHIKSTYPEAPIVAVGTSFGANQLMRYLGEVGDKTNLVGAVSLAAPFDVDVCVDDMEGTVYEDFFVKMYFEKNFLPNMDVLLSLKDTHGINFQDVVNVKKLRDYHTHFTVKIYNHKDVADYFSHSKILDSHIKNIKVPLLVLHAKDDPIASYRCIPINTLQQNPNIITAETARGGHLCWFTGLRPKRWYGKPTVEFTERVLEMKGKERRAAASQ